MAAYHTIDYVTIDVHTKKPYK